MFDPFETNGEQGLRLRCVEVNIRCDQLYTRATKMVDIKVD